MEAKDIGRGQGLQFEIFCGFMDGDVQTRCQDEDHNAQTQSQISDQKML